MKTTAIRVIGYYMVYKLFPGDLHIDNPEDAKRREDRVNLLCAIKHARKAKAYRIIKMMRKRIKANGGSCTTNHLVIINGGK